LTKRQFLFGSASGVVQLVFIAALAIVCIPVFIAKLGSEAYGVFAVVTLVGNLTVFATTQANIDEIQKHCDSRCISIDVRLAEQTQALQKAIIDIAVMQQILKEQ
jgi:hypothetical protein